MDSFQELRRQAEKLLADRPQHSLAQPSDILNIIHELQVYQTELTLQNEELLQAQLEISELHDEYANLYQLAPCGYVTLNGKGVITRANLAAVRMLGRTKQSLLKFPFSHFIAPEFEPAFLAARQQSAESGERQTTELQIKTESTTPLWVLILIDSKRDVNDVVIEWLITLTDIVEQKKVEAELSRSESHHRALLMTIPDLIWLKDPNGVYLSCNKGFETFFGADESEIIGKTDYDFVEQELADFFREHDCKTMEINRASKNEEWLTFAGNGYHGLFETIKTPMRLANGQLIGVLGVSRDITERHHTEQEKTELERQLKQSQKMEAIGTLAGGVAHDFNNILASIIGFTELALEGAPRDSSQEDSLQEVLSAGHRGKELVKQILAFARQSEESSKLLDLGSIAREVLKFIKSVLPTSVEVIQSFESTSPVMANSSQLHQVLMNLCTNAAHAMQRGGGVLEVGLRDVVVDTSSLWAGASMRQGNYVELTVSDTGHGIDNAIIDNIFEPYFTTKDVGEGTGMGLAMVKGIIDHYGGEICVTSRRNEKTVFSVYLPTASSGVSPVSVSNKEALPEGNERVLFIDDEPTIVKMGSRMLQTLGYSVTSLTNSAKALKLFEAQPHEFDIVVTDMTMPQMTGKKLCMQLRKIRPDIPVIICSGYSKEIDAATAAESGVNGYISKPITRADFAITLRAILDRTIS